MKIENTSSKNVLLIAMSTFNPTLQENTYEYSEGDVSIEVKGISQLEPGTKCVIELLKKEHQHLDKIVVMNTNATKKEENVILSNQETTNISPFKFYKNRIKEFVGEKYDIDFVDINIEDNQNQKVFFLEVAEKIIQDSSSVNLYMDMQGGDRNTAFYMNSIAELLKNQNVTIKKRIAIRFTPKAVDAYQLIETKQDKPYTIEEVSEKYQSYELLTAMKVFKEYGWGKELVAFFDNSKNEADKKLVEVIKEASEAIQTCNVQKFDSSISKIKKFIKSINTNKDSVKISAHMQIILKEIEKDYGVLLQDDVRLRYVEQIRWCLRKGFVQQALSILEAKMPHEYVVSGLKYYCMTTDNKEEIIEKFKIIYNLIKEDEDHKHELYKMQDINHFFIRDLDYTKKRYKEELEKEKIKFNIYYDYLPKKPVNINIDKYQKLCQLRNKVAHVVTSVDKTKKPSFLNDVYGRETISEPDLITEITNYLDEFEKLTKNITPHSVNLE